MKRNLAVLVLGLSAAAAAVAQPVAQKSSRAGVSVTVTPLVVAPAAKEWTFRIVLDTHSQDLADDLLTGAQLVDEKGRAALPHADAALEVGQPTAPLTC